MVPWHSTKRHSSGFTLIELLVALALMGILAAWSLPNFQTMGERSAVTSEINRLQTILAFARNTAITQRSDITVCPSNATSTACSSDWNSPVLVLQGDQTSSISDADILRVFAPTKGANVTKNGQARIKFNALGYAGGFNSTYVVCPEQEQTSTAGKRLVVSRLGRARVDEEPVSCSG